MNLELPDWNLPLLRWQHNAAALMIKRFSAASRSNRVHFLENACPAAGKTILAMYEAHDWLSRGADRRVIWLVPKKDLKEAIQTEAQRHGMRFSRNLSKDKRVLAAVHGVVATYQALDADVYSFLEMCSAYQVLVIMDECHHLAGENRNGEAKDYGWGHAAEIAFELAAAILLLSGTAWRGDNHAIPFCDYDDQNTVIANDTYGYADALTDTRNAGDDLSRKVVRELLFNMMGGKASFFLENDDVEVELNGDLPRDLSKKALRTALDPEVGEWFADHFNEAHASLKAERRDLPYADNLGIAICPSIWHAQQFAKISEKITGEQPWVITYKDDNADELIRQLKTQRDNRGRPIKTPQWVFSISKISEGTDIPRATHLFYATNVTKRLFAYQGFGRVQRYDKPKPNDGGRAIPLRQAGRVWLPNIEPLITYAEEIKQMCLHVLRDTKPGPPPPPAPESIWVPKSNEAMVGPVIYDGHSTESSYVKIADNLIAKTPAGNYLTRDLLAIVLETGHKSGQLNLTGEMAHAEEPEINWEDGLEQKAAVLDNWVRTVAETFLKETSGEARTAILSYFKKDMKLGARNTWHEDKPFDLAIAECERWARTGKMPNAIKDLFNYLQRGNR